MMGERFRRFLFSEARGLGSELSGLVDSGRNRRKHDYDLPLSHNRTPLAISHPECFEML